jgi:dTDP-4-amino-4,6-dideoxygalactose transaminase
MKIPLAKPEITHDDIRAVNRVLGTSRLSLGSELEEFERSVAQYVGAAHALAVNSGTSALHLCIRALGIGPGDEVIVPSFAFIAVANAVRYEKATPVFVDIEPATLNLDPLKVEAALSSRTRAIIVVHTFGFPAELRAIMALAKRHRLFVIEDASEAFGAQYGNGKVGALADFGVFAFYPNKQITTGEGGMVVTNNPETASLLRSLRNQGRRGSEDWLDHFELGYNYRISELNCALGNEQIKRIETSLARREWIARQYHEGLWQLREVSLPALNLPQRRISWFAYVVRLGHHYNREHRDWLRTEMLSKGIECARYFAPIHLQPVYRRESCRKTNLPVTEAVADRCLALPFFTTLSERHIKEVCRTLAMLLRTIGTVAGDGSAPEDLSGQITSGSAYAD